MERECPLNVVNGYNRTYYRWGHIITALLLCFVYCFYRLLRD